MSDVNLTAADHGTERRWFTVQCGYAGWHACTVVVNAGSVEQACERAIEEANMSPGWSSVDACGPTFVDAIAEGDDVDPWQADSRVPVPLAFAEYGEVQMLREALLGLLGWAAVMGGWEAEAWRAAERAVGRAGPVGTETE